MTPEATLSEEFWAFLNRQILPQRLDRIVIDECHVLLHDQAEFRPELRQLGKLVGAKVQIVMLTATLPPTQEDLLLRKMHIPWRKL